MKKIVIFVLIFCTCLCARISPNLLREMSLGKDEIPFMIEMKQYPNLEPAKKMSHLQKGRFIVNELMRVTKESQKEVIETLKKSNVKFESFWISNSIGVFNGNLSLIEKLKQRNDIELLSWNGKVKIELPKPTRLISISNNSIEWNVKFVNIVFSKINIIRLMHINFGIVKQKEKE